ncbi:uncharacterized protein LOC129740902 isoform X2 [Uranotaenia lowii]|uniref:uncharacterized protein LOC129740902 isoform X2 n=1 Tax=Uranotaenia lowii TaxID=190385 RepID=UPI00247A386C|nr:uncharacterized protein LOC129740902 isoform X2 [Uranotaenia lowii]
MDGHDGCHCRCDPKQRSVCHKTNPFNNRTQQTQPLLASSYFTTSSFAIPSIRSVASSNTISNYNLRHHKACREQDEQGHVTEDFNHQPHSLLDISNNNCVSSDTQTRRSGIRKPSGNRAMAEPFSASAAFTNSSNNNNNDGWGDDWGDWGGNSNPVAQPPPKASAPQQTVPVNTNQYFQQKQPQYPHLDQSNRNFIQNVAPQAGLQQPSYQNYGGPVGQSHFQQPYAATHQQQHPSFGQVPAPTAFFNQQPNRPPSHPTPSTTPQSFNQNITDSFNTNSGDSWNWSAKEVPPVAPSPKPAEVPQYPPPTQHQVNAFQDHSYPQQTPSPNNFSIPGAGNNTQPTQQPPKAIVPQLARLKNETLSPQWSIESQVSQTSSDRSIESGEIGESRSSHTIPSDDGSSGRVQGVPVENYEHVGNYNQFAAPPPVDKLDEALSALNIKHEPQPETSVVEQESRPDTYRESSFPPPPPSIANQQSMPADGALLPPKSSSQTPPLPPPPTEQPNQGPPQGPPPGPPISQGPPKGTASGNPFKRVGSRSQHATLGRGTVPPLTSNNFFYQLLEMANVEMPTPENQEIPGPRVENFENLEIVPSNDRNQYLQTGHLSEEGYSSSQRDDQQQPVGDDSLPPPGLSRYVPGQQQQPDNNQQLSGHSFPPPGLDRMIPGTDLDTATPDLNMERQIDGEVSDSASTPIVRSSASGDHHHGSHHHSHRQQPQEEISDRNLYLVPGESDNTHHSNPQRVIPGVEDDRPSQVNYAPIAASPIMDIPINEQQRELVMDGENPHDPPVLPIQVEISRDEPIEGANTFDEPANSNANQNAAGITETDASLTVEGSRKDPSNTSTADESDKERSMYYGKGKPARREEDPLRRSTKSKSSRDRYDTEDSDYSDREGRRRREREGSNGIEAQQRDRRRGGGDRDKEKERRKDGGRDRDRDPERDRDYDHRDRDYDYRDRERGRYDRDRDRYGRGGGKYERDDRRYETDGSKYDAERSTRYDRDGDGGKRYMSREEYYRKREERAAAGGAGGASAADDDRRYRKEKDRTRTGGGDRYREDRRKDDRYREGGEKRRDRRYDYEDYRTGSRNGTERDRERDRDQRDRVRDSRERDDARDPRKDRKYLSSAAGGTGPYGAAPYASAGGYYDPYSYYTQHQQYYEQLRRNNPQAYAEWYRTYYSQMQATQMQRDLMTSDGRESVHSGRSSANDKERLDNTDGSIRQEPSSITMMEPERLTPRKFPEIHPIVSLSCGLLVATKNRLTVNGSADVVKIFSLGAHDPTTRRLFQSYPGPLGKDRTHKKSVIEFCEEQLRNGPPSVNGQMLMKSRGNSINSLHSLGANVNRGSFTLLWNYIILLLRQNGTFVGTDISELLMQNKTEFPFESAQLSARSTNLSGRNSSLSTTDRKPAIREVEGDGQIDEDRDDTRENVENVTGETEQFNNSTSLDKKETMNELEITEKFRNYLIYGNISDALEWATENNLWGHALFLASKVDSRQHANVMMKFANKLALNDPLQTLYQLLSGRTPSAVSCVQDEKWGDWRPHLAMLMSNSSAKPELIKKSITTLGDSLYNRGDLYAAHFCYLLSDVTFGRFSDVKQDGVVTITTQTAVRLVLLGSSHLQRSFREFATNESIMMTEIYEYARSLNEDRYSITELQFYKYLLASRMLDFGMQLKCLLYMEQIAEQIAVDPYRFDSEFIKKVYTFGDRLKYYDPVLEKALDESVDNTGRGNIYANIEDPAWLQRLSTIITNYNHNQMSYEGSHQQEYNSSQFTSYLDYPSDQQSQQLSSSQEQQSYVGDSSDINRQFTEINQQFDQLNLQYTDGFDRQQQHHQQQQQQQQQLTPSHQQQQFQPDHQTGAPSYDQGYDSINQPSLTDESSQQPPLLQPAYPQQGEIYDQQQQQQQQQQPQSIPHYGGNPGGYGDGSTLGQQPGMFVPASTGLDAVAGQPNSYDYWGANAEPVSKQIASAIIRSREKLELPPTSYGVAQPAPPVVSNHHHLLTHHHSCNANRDVEDGARGDEELLGEYDEEDEEDDGEEREDDEDDDVEDGGCGGGQVTHHCSGTLAVGGHGINPVPGGAGLNYVAKPTISMPNAVSNRSGYNDEDGSSAKLQNHQSPDGQPPKPNAEGAKKGPQSKDNKQQPIGQNANSGWFGGIWNKLSLKPKNQMILPDDKNPTIVWDPEKKRWINTEEGEAGEEAFKPPPKMADLMPNAAASPSGLPAHVPPTMGPPGAMGVPTGAEPVPSMNTEHPVASVPQPPNVVHNVPAAPTTAAPAAPKATGEPTKVPNLQSNMFKMQRNRTLKQSYVNVFNPPGAVQSKAPTEPILAPTIPPITTPQSGFFIPGPAPMGVTTGSGQGNDNATEGGPNFYNPNQFAGGYQQ